MDPWVGIEVGKIQSWQVCLRLFGGGDHGGAHTDCPTTGALHPLPAKNYTAGQGEARHLLTIIARRPVPQVLVRLPY